MLLPSQLRHAALTRLRRNGRPVLWPPEWMRFGNLLYAYELLPSVGAEAKALATSDAAQWRAVMPRLDELVVDRSDVRWNDRRILNWFEQLDLDPHTERPVGHSWEVRQAFISDYLISPGPFRQILDERRRTDPRDMVLNVRRGDYATDEEIRTQFGMDTVAYIRTAMDLAEATGGEVRSVHVVSDDVDWARQALGWLGRKYEVTFPSSDDGPIENFADAAGARRLTIMNSTFSYWAGYVSKVLHPESEHLVVAPRFFSEARNDGRSWNLEPGWTIVEGIPALPPRHTGV